MHRNLEKLPRNRFWIWKQTDVENSKLKLNRKLKYISEAERSFVMEIEVLVDFRGVNWIEPRDFSINFFFSIVVISSEFVDLIAFACAPRTSQFFWCSTKFQPLKCKNWHRSVIHHHLRNDTTQLWNKNGNRGAMAWSLMQLNVWMSSLPPTRVNWR